MAAALKLAEAEPSPVHTRPLPTMSQMCLIGPDIVPVLTVPPGTHSCHHRFIMKRTQGSIIFIPNHLLGLVLHKVPFTFHITQWTTSRYLGQNRRLHLGSFHRLQPLLQPGQACRPTLSAPCSPSLWDSSRRSSLNKHPACTNRRATTAAAGSTSSTTRVDRRGARALGILGRYVPG